jgi:hypothetical protein
VPALVEDGVRQAWETVELEQRVRAAQVVGVHTRWAPTDEDSAFIGGVFPGALVTHQFLRPDDDGWDLAFAAAGVVLQAELRPVLWSASSVRAGALADVPHWSVAGGGLHLALTVVAGEAMYHVTHEQFGDASFDEVMADACRGLVDDVSLSARGDGVWAVAGRLVAAVACLPDFYRLASSAVEAERMVVGLPSADLILVAGAEGSGAGVVEREVLDSTFLDAELVPCVLSVEGDRIGLLVERKVG